VEIHPALYAVLFLLGLCFGSFFNVAIYRWPNEDPKEREWVLTPSHCPRCKARIRWYDNIPLISFIVLRGKCRDCQAPIHWRYPAVELGTALLWLVTAWLVTHIGLSNVSSDSVSYWHIGFAILFASLYLLTIIIDFRTSLIPDQITITHFVFAWVFMLVCSGVTISPGWVSSLIGVFVLSLFFLIFWYFGGMGLGDVFLAAGFGVLFGWQLVIVVGFVGILLGGLVAVGVIAYLTARGKYRRGIPIPFGPYLAISAFFCLFWGQRLLDWYMGFLTPGGAASGVTPGF
jgi:leader peptidase (prepilin peptidase)/N-methyltransferase